MTAFQDNKNEIFLVLSPNVLATRLRSNTAHEVGAASNILTVYKRLTDNEEYQATHIVGSEEEFTKLKLEVPDAVLMLRTSRSDLELVASAGISSRMPFKKPHC